MAIEYWYPFHLSIGNMLWCYCDIPPHTLFIRVDLHGSLSTQKKFSVCSQIILFHSTTQNSATRFSGADITMYRCMALARWSCEFSCLIWACFQLKTNSNTIQWDSAFTTQPITWNPSCAWTFRVFISATVSRFVCVIVNVFSLMICLNNGTRALVHVCAQVLPIVVHRDLWEYHIVCFCL